MARHWISISRMALTALVAGVLILGAVPANATNIASSSSGRLTEPMLLSRAGTSSVVYVFVETKCARARCAGLYRSNIGATSFVRVTAPPVKLDKGEFPNSTLEKLVFANPHDGYALVGYGNAGAMLYATSNGAHTWRRAARVDQGEMTLVVSSSQVFLATEHCTPRTSQCAQWLTRRSNLNAKRWTTIPRLWRSSFSNSDFVYGPALAAYGEDVWELETGPHIDLWTSRNDGITFTRRVQPMLGSVAGCSFTTISATSLWAECPTGMQVSFLHSGDGGIRWSYIRQTQFFGTGGGAFDPVSSSVAYLDYGLDNGPDNIFRLTAGGRVATPVANVKCANVPTMVFTTASQGLMLCNQNYTSIQLRRTDNGGVSWKRVDLPSEEAADH